MTLRQFIDRAKRRFDVRTISAWTENNWRERFLLHLVDGRQYRLPIAEDWPMDVNLEPEKLQRLCRRLNIAPHLLGEFEERAPPDPPPVPCGDAPPLQLVPAEPEPS